MITCILALKRGCTPLKFKSIYSYNELVRKISRLDLDKITTLSGDTEYFDFAFSSDEVIGCYVINDEFSFSIKLMYEDVVLDIPVEGPRKSKDLYEYFKLLVNKKPTNYLNKINQDDKYEAIFRHSSILKGVILYYEESVLS